MKFLSVLIGSLSTSIVFSVMFYFLSLNSSSQSGGNFISFSPADSAKILAIVGAVLGLIAGGVTSVIVIWLRLNLLKAIIFEFVFYCLVSIAILLITKESWTNDYMRYTFYAFMINGIIIGIILSIINSKITYSE
jgi:hypothetical protein